MRTKRERLIGDIVDELARRELREHLGRMTTITMKKSGRVLDIIRTGYGAMEYPERDSHEVRENGEVVAQGKTLYEIANWIINQRG